MARLSRFMLRLAGFMVIALSLSCTNPISSISSLSGSDSREGSLTITIENNIARTLVPGINMTAASYTAVGVGPAGSGATFNKPIVNNTLTVTSLVSGAWTVTVNAWNGASGTGTVIGNGVVTVTVGPGQAAAAVITVAPLAGLGTLSLSTS